MSVNRTYVPPKPDSRSPTSVSRPTSPKVRQRRLKPEERRRQLVEAAIFCLAKYGAQGAGLRQICRHVDVAPGLVSYLFPGGLNELLLAAYGELAGRFVAELEAAAKPDGRSADVRLQAIFELYFSPEWLDDTVVGAYVALWSLSRTELDLKVAMSGLHRKQKNAVLGPLEDLVANRGTRPDVKLLADCLVVFLTDLWLDIGLNPANISPKRALKLCRVWLDGSLAGQE